MPQLYNARRFNTDLSRIPRLLAIERRCSALGAFAEAAPEAQPAMRHSLAAVAMVWLCCPTMA